MKLFRDLTIKRKLLLLNLIICGAVLFVALAALFVFQILNFRANFIRDTATLAAVVANNSTAALLFKDAKDAAEVVNSLRAKPTVVGARLVTADGSTLARFGDTNDASELSLFPPAGEYRFAAGHLLYTAPVELDGKQLGKLYLRANYQQTFLALLGFYALVIGGVMIASILLAVFLSGRLGRTITLPVLQLAHTAQIVGEKKDYSVRAPVGTQGDEVGRLTAAFNQMLSRIEAQDQALKESQERFEVAIAGANDGIWDWNLKTNEAFFSPKWKRIIGYADGDIPNNYAAWESLLHPADLAPTRAVLQDYLEGRRPVYEVEFRMREKNGQYRWILARGAALRDANHKPYRMAGSHTDINGRKQAENEVHAAREKIENLVNSIDGIVWECDAKSIEFTFVSRQSERILGYTLEQWLANPRFWQDHLHPEDAVRAVQTCHDSIAARKPYNYEYRMIAADGREVWIRESGDVLVENDQPVLVRGIFQDITERKRAEEALRQSEELFSKAFRALSVGVTIARLSDGQFLEVNDAFLQLFGFRREEVLGHTALELGLWANSQQRCERLARLITEGSLKNVEGKARKKSGEHGDMITSMELVELGGEKCSLALFTDITERKRAEAELKQAHEELLKTSRLAGMAEVATGVLHNVGNVLNSVNVSSTLIHDKLRNSEVATLVQLGDLLRQHEADLPAFLTADSKGKLIPGFIIQLADQLGAEQMLLQKEQEKLGRNIEHIKEIVALQQNHARVSGIFEPVSLANLVDDALQMNTAGLSRHGVQVVRHYAEVPPATADKHKVFQILVNLMLNAKYALDESSRLDKRLTVGIGMNGGNRLKVTVSDNGIGIPPENLNRIFSHGFSTRKGGHGFGLHSGANAAKEMGGQLSVHSEGAGQGATFTLELPLANPKAEPRSERISEERTEL